MLPKEPGGPLLKNWVWGISSIGLFLCSESRAITGRYLPASQLPNQSCLILVKEVGTGTPLATCSGTLISPTQVLSAGLCKTLEKATAQALDAEIHFPNGEIRKVTSDAWEVHAAYKGSSEGDPHDLSILEFREPVHIQPLSLPESKEKFKEIYQSHHCAIYGYGQDNSGQTGTHHGGTAAFQMIFGKPAPIHTGMIHYDLLTSDRAHLAPGDFGGGLYCAGADGRTYLMGVHSKMLLGALELSTSVMANQEWIEGHLLHPKFPTQAQLQTDLSAPSANCRPAVGCLRSLAANAIAVSEDVAEAIENGASALETRKSTSKIEETGLRSRARSLKEEARWFFEQCAARPKSR